MFTSLSYPSQIEPTSITFHLNRIVHSDCFTFMPQFAEGSVDFILTDPPYLVSYRSRDGRTVPNDDNDRWLKPAFAKMHPILADDSFCVSFYGLPSADKFLAAYREAGFRVVGHLMFPKQYASAKGFVNYQHECAHLLAKGSPWQTQETISDVIPWAYTGNRLHPTQKPLTALLPLIEAFCPREGLVFDPFAGSGSTSVCVNRLVIPISMAKLTRQTTTGSTMAARPSSHGRYDQPAQHDRQPYHKPHASLGATGHWIKTAGILAPLVIGEFVKDPEQRWRYIRIASVATALVSEGLWTHRLHKERDQAREQACPAIKVICLRMFMVVVRFPFLGKERKQLRSNCIQAVPS